MSFRVARRPSLVVTGARLLMLLEWCPWPESNQHSLRNSILSRARLPIPPQGHPDVHGKAERREAGGI
jgi:hypothetical protein